VKDRLFRKLSIREVDYSYGIDAASMLYEPNGITKHAQKLITEYAAARRALEDVGGIPILRPRLSRNTTHHMLTIHCP
jgi:hypothetical protein